MRTLAKAAALCALSTAPALIAHAAEPQVVYKACEKKPSTDDTEAAKGLFSAGKVSYNEGDYPKAITLWRDAFERDCTANLLLQNLANAYEKAGNLDAAITTLETFLKRDPQNGEAPTIQKRIENMKKAKAAAATTSTATTTASATSTAPPPPPPATTSATAPTSTSAASRPLTPLYVAGAGGVLAIVGGALWLKSNSDYNSLLDKCPLNAATGKRDCPAGVDSKDGEKYTTQMYIRGAVFGVGVAGVAGGLAWYFLSKPEQQTSRFFSPTFAPGYAGATVGGHF